MAGYSGTALLKKLGIKQGFKVCFIGEPMTYIEDLGPLPLGVKKVALSKGPLDLIHLFAPGRAIYEKQLLAAKKALAPHGMIWASWTKKSSKIVTDLTEEHVRNFALKNGLVDIKVCAVDETWSALKLVIPVKDRK